MLRICHEINDYDGAAGAIREVKSIATGWGGHRRRLHDRRVVPAQTTDETLRLRRWSFVTVLMTARRTLRGWDRQ